MSSFRFKLIFFIFFIFFVAVLVRLFSWQILRGASLSAQARGQYTSTNVVSAGRGNILAQDESWLVARSDAWLAYASLPELKKKPQEVADKLAPLLLGEVKPEDNYRQELLQETSRLEELLGRGGVVWVPLKHKVDPQTKKNIEALGISGIGFEPEESRVYPEASAAAQLLGFVGKDAQGGDKGYFGLEGFYDLALSGKPGFVAREKDAKGIPILLGESKEVSAMTGVDLITNIDKRVQLTLEKILSEGIEKYGAKGGTAIVMRPADGAILGMASYPSYDPAKYWQWGDEYFKNPAVSDSFEPGSIFKVLVMSAALDVGAVTPETVCDKCDSPLKVDKYTIETWNKKYHPDSTMTDVIVNSDNVGMAFVGQKLGADKLHDYLDKFGIGEPTGVDLQGEATPVLREKGTWNVVDLATASFGQGVAVTPIQMVRAVGAIANGGRLVTPQVVDKLKGDGWEEDIKPKEDGRVVSGETASEITQMMVTAAKNGEAKWTALRGFNVAGKTGTAQIPIAGHYDSEKTIGSFVGFAPADKPRFVMLVTLREPTTSPWASETAAPLWYSILKDLIPYFGIQPED